MKTNLIKLALFIAVVQLCACVRKHDCLCSGPMLCDGGRVIIRDTKANAKAQCALIETKYNTTNTENNTTQNKNNQVTCKLVNHTIK